MKLAIALRYLAGGSQLDLRLIYHVSSCYVYKCVWAVVDANRDQSPRPKKCERGPRSTKKG